MSPPHYGDWPDANSGVFLSGYNSADQIDRLNQLGAIIGSKNASKERLFEAAIKRACLAENGAKLRAIAEKLTDMAVDGDIQAIKETLDRVDGKSKQPIIGGDDGDPPVLFARIERVIVENAANKDG